MVGHIFGCETDARAAIRQPVSTSAYGFLHIHEAPYFRTIMGSSAGCPAAHGCPLIPYFSSAANASKTRPRLPHMHQGPPFMFGHRVDIPPRNDPRADPFPPRAPQRFERDRRPARLHHRRLRSRCALEPCVPPLPTSDRCPVLTTWSLRSDQLDTDCGRKLPPVECVRDAAGRRVRGALRPTGRADAAVPEQLQQPRQLRLHHLLVLLQTAVVQLGDSA